MSQSNRPDRSAYRYFSPMTTRWLDNDVYGHINNALYYQFFDTAVNTFLIDNTGLDISNGETVAFIVASSCQYHAPLAYPVTLDIGVRVNRLGRSSVEYGTGVFQQGEPAAAADGTFTHVYVNRSTQQSVPLDATVRETLATLTVSDQLPDGR